MKRLIIKFFKELFSEGGLVSSKRFQSFETWHLVAIMVLGEQFFGFPLNLTVFETLITLIVALGGYTTAIAFKKLTSKKDLANNIIDTTSDTEKAKEVFQSNNPKE